MTKKLKKIRENGISATITFHRRKDLQCLTIKHGLKKDLYYRVTDAEDHFM